jgi:formate hydrogenlyase subunit 6/NADH:ubiquinone oxidoreductase subunit I
MFSLIHNIISNIFSKPATWLYPFVVRQPFTGSRGKLEMDPDTCIYCGICSKRCPANAINVTKTPAKTWTLDPYRCIVCAECVSACPKKCLSMNPEHRD